MDIISPYDIEGRSLLTRAYLDLPADIVSLRGGDLNPDQQNHSLMHMHDDGLDHPEHNSYSIFSSSLEPNYGLAVDSMYPQNSFPDPLPAFQPLPSAPYIFMGSLPSSCSSGRSSSLTPNDSVSSLQHPSSFFNGHPKEYPHPLLDRRLSSYSSELINECGLTGQSADAFQPTSAVDHFQDRLGRLPNNTHHPDAAVSPPLLLYRPLNQYICTPNRLAFGECSVIVMSPKVAPKSYGKEKRFLCPPPTAIMIGNSWWSDVVCRGEEPKLCPPRVVISISGDPAPREASIEWTDAVGKAFDVNDPPTGTTYIGRCVGKQLFISDVKEGEKKVEALVKILDPTSGDEPERVVGIFHSRPIKVISSKPKKKSTKSFELCIHHGSVISLFHRLRSQTVTTKYLRVSGTGSSSKGSYGAPFTGLDQCSRTLTPSFIAGTASWDPFIMYIVDINKPAGGIDNPPPPQADYPTPPANAIPFTNNGPQIPIYYNQTIVLQCLTTGVISPVLIIRKVDHQTTVVGGGLQEGAKGIADYYCAPGEVCGDPVSQLDKIAFEVYDGGKGAPDPGTPDVSGAFLSCMGKTVNIFRPVEGRIWNNPPSVAQSELPSGVPSSPIASTPAAGSGPADYFDNGNGSANSAASPDLDAFASNNGGKVERGKRGSSSAGALRKPPTQNGRRKPTYLSSAGTGSTGSSRRGSSSDLSASSGALWRVDVGETSVWTIVGTTQIRYNCYISPGVPVMPFPSVVKYLPRHPDYVTEAPKPC
ncbi:hypothetical protein K474DRAFT_1713521 [Panus rudis PR-1116 ss-1]|nr:hypothetical protein K474DRAFT_1713521 [Panus rudis PR-1116 ss-1]